MSEVSRKTISAIDTSNESIRILHVDDEPDFADLVATFLERESDHFSIKTENSASAGLETLETDDFDCIVSDYDMPGQNGVEFLNSVREEYPDLPFILFTGKGSEEVASEAISSGATDYLQKQSGSDQYALLANRIENAVEQYRAQNEVRRRERQLYALLENSNDRLSVLDETGEYLFVSPAMGRLMGYDSEELLGRSGFEYVHPEDRDKVRAVFERLVENPEEVLSVEYRYQHADGTWRWVESRGKNHLGDPAIEGIIVNSRDITERKERERELERTQARFDALTENTELAVVTIDDESQVHYANDAVEDLFGYQPDELIGESLLTIMPERFHSAHTDAIERYLRHGDRQLDWSWIELPAEHRDGHEVPLGISFGETTVEGKHRFTSVLRDISERKEREREQEATIKLLRDLYDVTTDTDLEFEEKIDLLLELGCERLDLSYAFLTRIQTEDVENSELGTQNIVQAYGDHELLQPGESCPLKQAYCRKTIQTDGLLAIADAAESGWEGDPAYQMFDLGCYIGGTVVVDDELYGTLCFASTNPREKEFSDAERTLVRLMSQWMSYELERRQVTTELQRQNDRLDEFASVVAHDLRNPLNVADGRLDLAQRECDTEHLDHVENALDRMNTLIDDVLALAKEGKTVTEMETVDLATTVEECWTNVETGDATLQIETDQVIRADRSRLIQLLENLVRNAVEHSGEIVTVTVGELDDGFYVEDDGSGIPEDERDEVFGSGYSTTEDGTGFGLAIVQEIVSAHDWQISVTEGFDGGAKFNIRNVNIEGI